MTQDHRVEPGPKVIGPYAIERELGRGGMGIVYLGRHLEMGRLAAIKVQLAGADAPILVERFQREASSLARLTHPGIVRVYDAGVSGGRLFMALEFVAGTSLEDRLQRTGPLESREAAELGLQLCSALEYLHQAGLLHRDLKPDNVLIDEAGVYRLTDFGVARDLNAQSLTATGGMVGTPAFMSPEQASGEKPKLGPHSDVYGLGATLFAALTGQAPFQGTSPVTIVTQIYTAPSPRPSSVNPAVDPALDELVWRCLGKEPEDRPPSAAALGKELEAFLAGELRAPAAPGRGRWVALGAAGLALLLACAGVSLYLARDRAPAPTPVETQEEIASKWREAKRKRQAAAVGEWLAAYRPRLTPDELREREALYAKLRYEELPPAEVIYSATSIPESDDLSRVAGFRALLAWARGAGLRANSALRAEVAEKLRTWKDEASVPQLAFLRNSDQEQSPAFPLWIDDSRLLVYGGSVRARLWDLGEGKAARWIELGDDPKLSDATVAGEWVYLCAKTKLYRFQPANEAGKVEALALPAGTISSGIHATKGHILIATGVGAGRLGGQVLSVNLETFQIEQTVEFAQTARDVAVSADGQEVLVCGGVSDAEAEGFFLASFGWNEAGRLVQRGSRGLGASGTFVRFTPNQERVVVGLNRTGLVVLDRALSPELQLELDPTLGRYPGLRGSELRARVQSQGLAFLPAGDLLALSNVNGDPTRGNEILFVSAKTLDAPFGTPRPVDWVRPLPIRPSRLACSSDGSLLAIGTQQGGVLVLPAPDPLRSE